MSMDPTEAEIAAVQRQLAELDELAFGSKNGFKSLRGQNPRMQRHTLALTRWRKSTSSVACLAAARMCSRRDGKIRRCCGEPFQCCRRSAKAGSGPISILKSLSRCLTFTPLRCCRPQLAESKNDIGTSVAPDTLKAKPIFPVKALKSLVSPDGFEPSTY